MHDHGRSELICSIFISISEETHTIRADPAIIIENQRNVSGDEMTVSGNYFQVSGNIVNVPGTSRDMSRIQSSVSEGTLNMLPETKQSVSERMALSGNEEITVTGKRTDIYGNQFNVGLYQNTVDQSGSSAKPPGNNSSGPVTVCNVQKETFNRELLQTVFPNYVPTKEQSSQKYLDSMMSSKRRRTDNDELHGIQEFDFKGNPYQASVGETDTESKTKAGALQHHTESQVSCCKVSGEQLPLPEQYQTNVLETSMAVMSSHNAPANLALLGDRATSRNQPTEAGSLVDLSRTQNNQIGIQTNVSGNYTNVFGDVYHVLGNVIRQKPEEENDDGKNFKQTF